MPSTTMTFLRCFSVFGLLFYASVAHLQNSENADERAIAIANAVMQAQGGQENWDNTRYLAWTFFDRRRLWWDKWEGRVRIESFSDSTIYLVHIHSGEGRVQVRGREIADSDSLKTMLKTAQSIWINDSYWLVMPFKLRDPGVNLRYLRDEALEDSTQTHVLELTFQPNIGDTPDNKYLVFVDQATNLVARWDYFARAKDETPRVSTPWANYQRYSNIWLSGDRGRLKLDDIQVADEWPSEWFSRF